MPESAIPRILMLEADDTARKKVKTILEDQGWTIVCETVSKQALDRLKQSQASPFHLFISNFRLPKMEGDDILERAKTISPLTQRMLMVPSDQTQMVIRAINKAEIHACIVTPVADQDLADKVRDCLDQFNRDLKHQQLKRVITHQNKQMVVIARQLKKKDRIYRDKINAQKMEKVRLSTKLRQANRQEKDPATLDERVRAHEIPLTPEALDKEFQKLAGFTTSLFDLVAQKAGVAVSFKEISHIINDTPPPEEANASRTDVIRTTVRSIFSTPKTPDLVQPGEPAGTEALTLENLVRIIPSKDNTRAFISLVRDIPPDLLTLSGLLELLREKNINFGIVEDQAIESWLNSAGPETKKFLIAEGETPVQGTDGRVEYTFQTDYTNPGKIQKDGNIDFRDRGEIPFVEKRTLLAVKTPAIPGKNGMALSGDLITVEEPLDPVFVAGNGTKLSEDGLSIHADLTGQPHLDSMGEISVNPELPINGDVDFETGNIDFNGNIIVTGTVKAGFTVKGVSLTAKEIEGATIKLSGDLHISDGINDADIVSVGNVYAKFINNSSVNAFGNVVVQKEIIDSGLVLSGTCENPTGVIIASQIAAKAGLDAGKIGTDTSEPAQIRVGGDDHINSRIQDINTRLQAATERLRDIRAEIEQVENDDQGLYGRITEKAQEQEGLQQQISTLKEALVQLKNSNDIQGVDRAARKIKKLSDTLKSKDQELNAIFETQDRHAEKIDRYNLLLDKIETANKDLVLKKKGLREFARKTPARPSVTAQGRITQGTTITTPNAAMTMSKDQSRCRISEKALTEDGHHYFKMEISDL